MENYNSDNRKFKGIWIPSEIWLSNKIKPLEKILLAEIISLDKGPGCRASNEYFSDFLKISERTVISYLNNLKKIGLIEEISFDGRNRYLKSCPEKIFSIKNFNNNMGKITHGDMKKFHGRGERNDMAGMKNFHVCHENDSTVSIYNTIDNIKDILLINKKESLRCLEEIGLIKNKTKKTKKIHDKDSIQYKLAEFLYREIEKQDPLFTEPNLNKWADIMNLIIYADKKDPEEIKKIILWAVKDKFHQNHLVEPMYLKRKYETLRKQCNNSIDNNIKKETYIDKIIKEFNKNM